MNLAEMPGSDWRIRNHGEWRVGFRRNAREPERRARKGGLFVASRVYRQVNSPREFWVRVHPYISEVDASLEVTELRSRLGRNPQAIVQIKSERDVNGVLISGLDAAWGHEYQTVTPTGEKGTSRYLGGNVGAAVVVMAFSSLGEPIWNSNDILDLATRQVRRIATRTSGVAHE